VKQRREGEKLEVRGDPDGWGPPASEREGEGAEVGRRGGGKKRREGSAGPRANLGLEG
jgi:hypothetical protein